MHCDEPNTKRFLLHDWTCFEPRSKCDFILILALSERQHPPTASCLPRSK